jgi:hypothetical protein
MKSTEPVRPGIGGKGEYQINGRLDMWAGVGTAPNVGISLAVGAPPLDAGG